MGVKSAEFSPEEDGTNSNTVTNSKTVKYVNIVTQRKQTKVVRD